MGKAELCTITFIKKNDSGIITLIVNNTREDIDLYSENQWETYTWTYKNPYTFTFFENLYPCTLFLCICYVGSPITI